MEVYSLPQWEPEEDINVDEPLKEVPFSSFTHRLGAGNIEDHMNYMTSVWGILHRMHIIPRAADRRWNRALREAEKEGKTESGPNISGEEMSSQQG